MIRSFSRALGNQERDLRPLGVWRRAAGSAVSIPRARTRDYCSLVFCLVWSEKVYAAGRAMLAPLNSIGRLSERRYSQSRLGSGCSGGPFQTGPWSNRADSIIASSSHLRCTPARMQPKKCCHKRRSYDATSLHPKLIQRTHSLPLVAAPTLTFARAKIDTRAPLLPSALLYW